MEGSYIPDMANPRIDLDAMTPEEKLELIDRLWESLGYESHSLSLSPEQHAELERRAGEELSLGETGASWTDVRKRIEEKLK